MFCPNCGSPLEEKARFCCNCGARVPQPESIPENPVPAPPVEEAAASSPGSPLSRPYRLTTLATAVTYGIQSQVATLGLFLAAYLLFLPTFFKVVSSENVDALDLEVLLKDP